MAFHAILLKRVESALYTYIPHFCTFSLRNWDQILTKARRPQQIWTFCPDAQGTLSLYPLTHQASLLCLRLMSQGSSYLCLVPVYQICISLVNPFTHPLLLGGGDWELETLWPTCKWDIMEYAKKKMWNIQTINTPQFDVKELKSCKMPTKNK